MHDALGRGVTNKAQLHAWKTRIETFCTAELRLALNPKTAIFPARLGVDFLGFRVFKTHRRLRRASKRRIVRSMRGLKARFAAGRIEEERVMASLASWKAHLAHGNTVTLSRRLFAGLPLTPGPRQVPDTAIRQNEREDHDPVAL